MEESHHRSIMDHLEMGSGAHHLQEDLSKGVLRTIHNVENGTLHFITIPPASSSREQEYIESSLLGADLLSNHLPNGLLVDYISNPGPSAPNNQFHQQTTNLMDHHNSIQTYTAEDLQTLVDASSLQTSENDRKLFLQFVNKPTAQLSHEAPVIVTNPKDMSTVNTLGDHDKLTQSQLTSVNHMPIATSGSNFIHYHHQDQLLSTTHSNMANLNSSGNILTTHHGTHHHHHPHPHHHHHAHHHAPVAVSHQIIQNTTQLQQQSLSQPQQQQQQTNQTHLSSIHHPMLQSDCVQPKLFHAASSHATVSTNIAISTATSQNCIQMPPLAPIKRVESPKRYLAYQMATPQQNSVLERPPSDIVSTEGFISREDLMECEPRSDDEDDIEPGTAHNTNSHFANTYLPHKKRLAKKLVVLKSTNHPDQFHRDSVISNDHQSQQNSGPAIKEKPKAFACQLCSESFEDQLIFFTHLKGHYEPLTGSPIDDGKGNDPKKKPKLPRVKHTKKLQNDKSSRTASEDLPQAVNYQPSQQTAFPSQVVNHAESDRVYQQQNQLGGTDVIVNPQQQTPLPPVCNDTEAAGEFSETEDMLEGIRNVVQKVQEAVDTDTNDGLGLSSMGRSTVDDKAWFQPQQQQQQQLQQQQQQQQQQQIPAAVQQSEMVKTIDFASDLDAQEIHINTGNDNFVLFLNKSDFQEQGTLSESESFDVVGMRRGAPIREKRHHERKIKKTGYNGPGEST